MRLELLLSLALAAPALRASAPQEPRPAVEEEDPEAESRPFRIPDHGMAKSRMARADEHIAAHRFAEAITELQTVLEDHRGDLLGGEHPPAIGRSTSKQPVYPGAARRARERLLRLPAEARKLYRDRFERDATAALERARANGDRGALAEIARRWPLARAAEKAWWALGDLEHERGEEDKARAAWGRALAEHLGDSALDLSTAPAWAAAEGRLDSDANARGDANAPGVRKRIAIARAGMESGSSAARSTSAFATALQPGPPGPLPATSDLGQESWPESVEMPDHPIKMRTLEGLFPARAADVVLVSTSLRLFGLHAWSGALLWDSGEPAGWDTLGERERKDYFDGIDLGEGLIAPTTGGRTAIAALQIPVSFVGSFRYSPNVPVTTIIPDRRLFAFDLETGARLWTHEPPKGWDGEGGSFAQRMSVAGPPIVCGGRVLAPYYRLQGRIDYHIGCFDLDTGALLWSTALISGQRELNMFGRAEHEFSAPPVVVVGERVIAQTQLGAVAALDLFTGELLWETLYDQVPLPKNMNIAYHANPRQITWHNGPPAVADGVVVAAPFDCNDLLGIDLATGSMLWSLPLRRIQDSAGGSLINQLVGARPGTVYVCGAALAALRAPRGLALSAPDASGGWNYADDRFRAEFMHWRPVLTGDRIVIPFSDERLEIDAETGRRIGSHPWPTSDSVGNLVVGPGEVTTLSGVKKRVSATFDWEILTERARADVSAHPADPGLVLTLGRLLADRGTSEWQRGQAGPARAHIDEAESVLSKMIAAREIANRSAGHAEGEASPAGAELHRVLRAKARLRAGLADRPGALAALKKARSLAPDPGALRDTLLEELALLRASEPEGKARGAAYFDAQAELERSCAELPILCDLAEDGRNPRSGSGASGLPRLSPLVGASARRDAAPWEVPAGLWVLLDRCAAAEDAEDSPAEFASLHAILGLHGNVDLPGGNAASLAADRIGALLREGRTEGYAAFEARAGELFEEAAAAHDAAALARVGRLYPHSKAAENADDRRLAWAIEAGDAAAVAEIVQAVIPRVPAGLPASAGSTASGASPVSGASSSVPSGTADAASLPSLGWQLSSASEREVRTLLRLASVLSRAGSSELSGALLRRLANARGDVRSDLDGDGGRTLLELAAGIPRWRPSDTEPPIGTFRQLRQKSLRPLTGDWEILGRLPSEKAAIEKGPAEKSSVPGAPESGSGDAGPLCAVLGVAQYRSHALVNAIQDPGASGGVPDLAFPSNVVLPILPRSSFGSTNPPLSRCSALAPGRILVATEAGVSAVDERGRMAWEWRAQGPAPNSITLAYAAGVAVVSIDHGAGRRSLQALDARTGMELWQAPIGDPGLSIQPVLSAERVVLLPSRGRRALVLDLFTGRETIAFHLDAAAAPTTSEDAWIQDDLLIVPWFLEAHDPASNHVVAYDLSSGSRAWRVAFGEDRAASSPRDGADAPVETDPSASPTETTPRGREPDARELAGVLQCGDRTWLFLRPSLSAAKTVSPAIYELAPRIGALSPLPGVRIAATDRVIGLSTKPRRFSIPRNVVFLVGGNDNSAEARLRAVDLDHGEQWAEPLQVSIGFLDQRRVQSPFTPIPPVAVSADAVAIAYSVFAGQGDASSTYVETFDSAGGKSLGSVKLSSDMGPSEFIRFYPLGDGLLVRGQRAIEVLR